MTTGSQEWSKYPFLIKSNRPGTKRGRSTAGRPTATLSLGISDHYKPKGRFFCDSKERCRYDLIEAFFGVATYVSEASRFARFPRSKAGRFAYIAFAPRERQIARLSLIG